MIINPGGSGGGLEVIASLDNVTTSQTFSKPAKIVFAQLSYSEAGEKHAGALVIFVPGGKMTFGGGETA